MNGPVGVLGVAVIGSLLAILVDGCQSSPPPSLYTLSGVGRVESDGRPATSAPAVIAIGPVILPDYLDRPQIVTRQSDYELALAPNDRWAAPLYDMVSRVLVEDVAQRLPSDRIVSFPQVGDASFEYRVAIDIGRFDVDASGEATLAARWQVYARSASSARLINDDTLRRRVEGPGYGAYAASLSALLADLGDRIADGVSSVRASAARPLAAQ
jgi:uncharacterized lipoprotein YmbA